MPTTSMRFSDLSTASVLNDDDILALSKVDGTSASGYMSYKATMIAIGLYLNKLATYSSDLQTTDKHIIGAINELKQLISLIPTFSIEVVQTLPTEDISDTTIYLTPSTDPETGNAYDEFIHVNNTWELVGSTAIDLSAYYTKLEVDALLANKVDKVTGKGLSTEDYTTEEKTKLSGIESGAEVNVQADWNQSDNTKDDYIKNKPSIPVISAHSDYSTGTKIGSVTVDGVETDFYAPTVSHNYGFHIDGSESVPSAKITYLADAVGMEPAKMDYTNDVFDYGSWKDAFFLPRSCMLKSDGTVDYYLDPDDYTKKADGTASDIANDAYDGNAMMEWGKNGRKIWYKIVPDANDDTSASVYIADYQVDEGYVDYPFHSFDGASHNHFYTPIFNGWLDTNNKLRSISGKQVMASKTATNEVTYAENNNPANTPIWNIEQYCDIVLITLLLWLMGKSTNTQDVFGNGISSGSQAGCEAYRTGSLNDKGMFYGKDGSVNTITAVKVFGMENFWGLQWRRYQGHLLIDGSQHVKMTYGQEDGSTADGFSLAGTGYINKGHQPTGTSGQYLKTQEYDSMGFYPKNANNTDASATKYYCDGLWFNNSGARVPGRGGTSNRGALDGAAAVNLNNAASNASWNLGASLSCKPLS